MRQPVWLLELCSGKNLVIQPYHDTGFTIHKVEIYYGTLCKVTYCFLGLRSFILSHLKWLETDKNLKMTEYHKENIVILSILSYTPIAFFFSLLPFKTGDICQ